MGDPGTHFCKNDMLISRSSWMRALISVGRGGAINVMEKISSLGNLV